MVAALTGEDAWTDLPPDAFAITKRLAFDRDNDVVADHLACAWRATMPARCARQLSTEVWEHLNRLYLRLPPVTMDSIWVHHAGARCSARRWRICTRWKASPIPPSAMAKAGISWSWAAISSGRSCWAGCWTCISAPPRCRPTAPKYFDWLVLLKFCTAFEPYTKLYTASIRPEKIAEFLLFDAEFPHSVRFSVDRVTEALARVAPGAPPARRAAVERLAGRLKAAVDFGQIDELMSRRHRRLPRRHHPAMREDPRSAVMRPISPMARRRCFDDPLVFACASAVRTPSPASALRTCGGSRLARRRGLMFYSIRHVTRFRYSAPVRESVMELRMQPRSEGPQTLRSLPDRHQSARPALCLYRSSGQRGLSFQSAARA